MRIIVGIGDLLHIDIRDQECSLLIGRGIVLTARAVLDGDTNEVRAFAVILIRGQCTGQIEGVLRVVVGRFVIVLGGIDREALDGGAVLVHKAQGDVFAFVQADGLDPYRNAVGQRLLDLIHAVFSLGIDGLYLIGGGNGVIDDQDGSERIGVERILVDAVLLLPVGGFAVEIFTGDHGGDDVALFDLHVADCSHFEGVGDIGEVLIDDHLFRFVCLEVYKLSVGDVVGIVLLVLGKRLVVADDACVLGVIYRHELLDFELIVEYLTLHQGVVRLVVTHPELNGEIFGAELVAEDIEGDLCPAVIGVITRRVDDGGLVFVRAFQYDACTFLVIGVFAHDRFDPNGDLVNGRAVDGDLALRGIIACGRRVGIGGLFLDHHEDVVVALCERLAGIFSIGIRYGIPYRLGGGDHAGIAITARERLSCDLVTGRPGPADGRGLQGSGGRIVAVVVEFAFGVEHRGLLDRCALRCGVVVLLGDLGRDHVVKERVTLDLLIITTEGKPDRNRRARGAGRLHIYRIGRKSFRAVDLFKFGIAVIGVHAEGCTLVCVADHDLYLDGYRVVGGSGRGEGSRITIYVILFVVDHQDLVRCDGAVRIGEVAPGGAIAVIVRTGVDDTRYFVLVRVTARCVSRPARDRVGLLRILRVGGEVTVRDQRGELGISLFLDRSRLFIGIAAGERRKHHRDGEQKHKKQNQIGLKSSFFHLNISV